MVFLENTVSQNPYSIYSRKIIHHSVYKVKLTLYIILTSIEQSSTFGRFRNLGIYL